MKAALALLVALALVGCAASSTPAAPVDVAMAAEASPTDIPPAEMGRILFRDKGCVTCHVNRRVEGQTGVIQFGAPDLSGYSNDADFLRRWLRNPSEVRPGTQMPKLPLTEADIEYLIAFLNQPRE